MSTPASDQISDPFHQMKLDVNQRDQQPDHLHASARSSSLIRPSGFLCSPAVEERGDEVDHRPAQPGQQAQRAGQVRQQQRHLLLPGQHELRRRTRAASAARPEWRARSPGRQKTAPIPPPRRSASPRAEWPARPTAPSPDRHDPSGTAASSTIARRRRDRGAAGRADVGRQTKLNFICRRQTSECFWNVGTAFGDNRCGSARRGSPAAPARSGRSTATTCACCAVRTARGSASAARAARTASRRSQARPGHSPSRMMPQLPPAPAAAVPSAADAGEPAAPGGGALRERRLPAARASPRPRARRRPRLPAANCSPGGWRRARRSQATSPAANRRGSAGAAVEIRADAAHRVVRRRVNRAPVALPGRGRSAGRSRRCAGSGARRNPRPEMARDPGTLRGAGCAAFPRRWRAKPRRAAPVPPVGW